MSHASTRPPTSTAPPVDEHALYEVVDGRRVELPPMGAAENLIASTLTQLLGHFARTNGLGRVAAETLFPVSPAHDPQRRPDVAFVSYGRWPRGRPVPSTNAWDVVPDLAIEVVSPSNTANEILAKIREYFQAGVQRVWVVYPSERLVYAYDSPTSNRVLKETDDLEGEAVLPGFRLPVTDLFQDVTGAAE
jgi:Uma2 family endonuclease